VRFLNPGVGPSREGDKDTLIAPQGMSLDSADPIQPGETRTVRITATDSLWQRERLDGLIRDADSRLGGLLFLYDANGQRHIASVSTAIIPTFN
jgi:methane/ammonia monooxygenase subunit B